MKTNKVTFSVRFDADQRAALDAVAASQHVDPSQLIRMCVQMGLPVVKRHLIAMSKEMQSLKSPPPTTNSQHVN